MNSIKELKLWARREYYKLKRESPEGLRAISVYDPRTKESFFTCTNRLLSLDIACRDSAKAVKDLPKEDRENFVKFLKFQGVERIPFALRHDFKS